MKQQHPMRTRASRGCLLWDKMRLAWGRHWIRSSSIGTCLGTFYRLRCSARRLNPAKFALLYMGGVWMKDPKTGLSLSDEHLPMSRLVHGPSQHASMFVLHKIH